MDADGTYLGTVAAHDVMNALAADDQAPVSALLRSVDPVTPASPLGEVLDRLDHGAGAVPVTDETGTITGWVRHRDLLNALSRQPPALTARHTRSGPANTALETFQETGLPEPRQS